MQRFRKTESNMVAVVQLVRASDCGSECRRFESDQPPKENDPKVKLGRSLFERLYKKSYFKACEARKSVVY